METKKESVPPTRIELATFALGKRRATIAPRRRFRASRTIGLVGMRMTKQ